MNGINKDDIDRLNKELIDKYGEELVEMITFAGSVKTLITTNLDMHPMIKTRQEMLLGELVCLWLDKHQVSMPMFLEAHLAVARAFETLSILARNAEAEVQIGAAFNVASDAISQAKARH